MKIQDSTEVLGKGIYTIPEAARLTGISPRRIRYWLKGAPSEQRRRPSPASLWQGEHSPRAGKCALGFLDLQEVRFVEAFLKCGVTWPQLRAAHAAARRRYGLEHPFCSRRFVTDGAQIIEELQLGDGPPAYEEVVPGQRILREVVQPFVRELEFADNEQLIRWWPLGTNRTVVLDPQRQFGRPISAPGGMATEILHAAFSAGEPVEQIAQWYEVEVASVRDAIDFEESLAA